VNRTGNTSAFDPARENTNCPGVESPSTVDEAVATVTTGELEEPGPSTNPVASPKVSSPNVASRYKIGRAAVVNENVADSPCPSSGFVGYDPAYRP
jgi:hypothetical protein